MTPFNSALETGVRSLVVLVAAYPRAHDLQRLVHYDYLTVHTKDAGGPPSLHPALPFRTAELLVRRKNVQHGLDLMISARLAKRLSEADGFKFAAEDAAGAFVANLATDYHAELRRRARWVVDTFDPLTAAELSEKIRSLFDAWTVEFQSLQPPYAPSSQA